MLRIRRTVTDGLPVATAAVVAVVCCTGVPAIATLFGGLAVGAILGIAGVAVLAGALVSGLILSVRARRRRRCSPSTRAPRA